jgi:hypothetical protein
VVEFKAGLDEDVTIDFAEGKKENPLTWFKSFLTSLGTNGLFKDFSEGKKKDSKTPDADADKKAVDMILSHAPKAAEK